METLVKQDRSIDPIQDNSVNPLKRWAANQSLIVDPELIEINPSGFEETGVNSWGSSENAKIFSDLSRGGVKLKVPGLTKDATRALPLTEIATAEDLKNYAEKITLVEDLVGVSTKCKNLELKHPPSFVIFLTSPAESKSFGKLIKLESIEDGKIGMYVDGMLRKTFELDDPQITSALNAAINIKKTKSEKKGSGITVPEINSGVTTLVKEVDFLKELMGRRILNYRPLLGPKPDAILSILLSHCERVDISQYTKSALIEKIKPFVDRDEKIPVSLSLAISTRIHNPLKFLEDINLPTYAWLHFGYLMSLIDLKIQSVYQPGIKIIVFDEAPLLGPIIDIDQDSIAQHRQATEYLLKAIEAPVEICPLESRHFPDDEVGKIQTVVDDEIIFSVLCCHRDLVSTKIMDNLYSNRSTRDYQDIRYQAGEYLWNDSKEKANKVAQYLKYRKDVNLFERLVGPIAIDATVTDKNERIVFDITTNSIINHAMPVIKRDTSGSYNIRVVPEYRINASHPNAVPVKIDKIELKAENGLMTFFYLDQ